MAAYKSMSIDDLRALIIRLREAQANPRINATNSASINRWIIAALDQMNVARGIA